MLNLRRALNILFILAAVFFFPKLVWAHDCSSPGDCMQTAGFNAMVAIAGGLIALAVIVALPEILAAAGVVETLEAVEGGAVLMEGGEMAAGTGEAAAGIAETTEAVAGSQAVAAQEAAVSVEAAGGEAAVSGEATTTAAETAEATTERTFASEQKLIQHFEKHAEEFGYDTPEEYLNGARELTKGGEGIETYVRPDGDKLLYNSSTNEFGVVSKDGVIRTYFKPIDGIDYWQAQIGGK